jgi:hypothetical protein
MSTGTDNQQPDTGRLERTETCSSCGQPGELDLDLHCAHCVEVAGYADSYGATVALDLLRAVVTQALSFAPAPAILDVVYEAINAAE